MLQIKFNKHENGYCENCGNGPTELFLTTIFSGDKSKEYIVCKNCAIKIKKQVDKKNEIIASSQKNDELICNTCGNKNPSSLKYCEVCGSPIDETTTKTFKESYKQNTPSNYVGNNYNNQMLTNQNVDLQPGYNKHNDGALESNVKTKKSTTMKLSLINDNKTIRNPQKIGGWLLFFCVSQVISCFSSFSNCLTDGQVNPIVLIFSIIFSIFTFLIIINILHKNAAFIKFFDIQTFLVLLFNIIAAIMAIYSGGLFGVLFNICGNLIYYVVWLEYFIKSKRCKIYFGSNEFFMSSLVSKLVVKKHF